MATDARFAIKERDELRYKLKKANEIIEQYLDTIYKLQEENAILKESLDEWRNAEPGELET